jgi:uncharacterized hydantoinase/oxoprolinase family protein
MAEHFATTADVYRLTENCLRADRLPQRTAAARRIYATARGRLARGRTRPRSYSLVSSAIARASGEAQLWRLRRACERVSRARSWIIAPLVGAGVGKLLWKLASRLSGVIAISWVGWVHQ